MKLTNLLLLATVFNVFGNVSLIQQNRVTGTVTDSKTGTALPGVNIRIEGALIGTITDISGSYSIDLPNANSVLVFSFIGYESQSITVGNQSVINVALLASTMSLDEVVVIGYGTQKKSDLTGSVSRVSMDEIKTTLANVNLSQALSGATPGLNVEGGGGAGGEPTLSIRGQTSLSASGQPLIVLDGSIYNGSINSINMYDVQSVDVLKDASAAAVYGSRSANGVLIITTKKGKSEKPVISFDVYRGYQDMTNNPMRVMNAEEFAVRLADYSYQQGLYDWYATKPTSAAGRPVRPDMTNRQLVSQTLRSYEEQNNYMQHNSIDWVDEVTQIAPIQNYNLSLSGGSEKMNYYLSSSYSDMEGIQLNDEFKRLTLHSNLESKVNDWLSIGLNTTYSYLDHSGLPANLYDARNATPLANNYIGSSSYDLYLCGELFQPYPLANLYVTNQNKTNEFYAIGTAKIIIPWIKGLTNELNYSNRFSTNAFNTFYPVTTPGGVSNKGQAIKAPSGSRDWIVNDIITYLRTFGDHQVNATILLSQEGQNGDWSQITAEGFDNETLGYNNLGLAKVAEVNSGAYQENTLSYMARANYSYKSRYMVTGTIRRDGYSGFGAGNKWATFPSVSLAWVLSDESFLRENKSIYLKLRTSYGVNGNQGIGRYSSLSRMSTTYYVYGPSTAIGLYPSNLGNEDLGWEKTTSFNIGLDYGFLNKRISGSIDVYKAKTEDVLVNRSLPQSSGYTNIWTNIGGIDNKGIEFELRTLNLDGKVRWESNFMFSMNRDKISKLYGGENDEDIGNGWFVGEPISAIYDYKMSGGVWQEEDLFSGKTYNDWYPGMFKYDDLNGDGAIEPSNDRTVVGYRTPSYRFSINNTISYSNFTFSFFINSVQGGNNYYLENNADNVSPLFYMDNRRNNSAINPYWRPDAPTNNTTGIFNVPPVYGGIYQSRSFVRLQDVSLTYRFGPALLTKLKMKAFQVYIASKNPYVWTKWQGWDPETGTSDTPLMRNIVAGIRLSF